MSRPTNVRFSPFINPKWKLSWYDHFVTLLVLKGIMKQRSYQENFSLGSPNINQSINKRINNTTLLPALFLWATHALPVGYKNLFSPILSINQSNSEERNSNHLSLLRNRCRLAVRRMFSAWASSMKTFETARLARAGHLSVNDLQIDVDSSKHVSSRVEPSKWRSLRRGNWRHSTTSFVSSCLYRGMHKMMMIANTFEKSTRG